MVMSLKQSILAIVDLPENLSALEKVLNNSGAELIKAATGEEALAERTLERDVALAILDVQTPDRDKYKLAELIRSDPRTQHLPIIFLAAAFSEEEPRFESFQSAAVDFIVKPYNPAVLVSKVAVFLELHAQKRELQKLRLQVEDVNKELKIIVSSVSHDLRAPLRAIEGFSNALLEDSLDKLNEEDQDCLKRVSSEARRMAGLVEDLVMLIRVSSTEIRIEPVNLSELAEEIIYGFRQAEPERRADIVIDEGLTTQGDLQQLYRTLENLLSNAWKFTSQNAEAKIELGRMDDVFFVRDNGVGFDMKYSDQVFSPFKKLHSMTEFPGSGVGLSIVQRIVARHDGRIWFESERGQGATFYFTLGGDVNLNG